MAHVMVGVHAGDSGPTHSQEAKVAWGLVCSFYRNFLSKTTFMPSVGGHHGRVCNTPIPNLIAAAAVLCSETGRDFCTWGLNLICIYVLKTETRNQNLNPDIFFSFLKQMILVFFRPKILLHRTPCHFQHGACFMKKLE